MLRLGVLSVVARNTPSRPSFSALSSSRLLDARCFSSKPLGNNPNEKQAIRTIDEADSDDTDKMRIFFEKRRAALQKEKQEQQGRNGNQAKMNNNGDKFRPPTKNSAESGTAAFKTSGENKAYQSFFEKRPAAWRKEPNGSNVSKPPYDRRQNNGPNNNNNNRSRWVPKGNQQSGENVGLSAQNNRNNGDRYRGNNRSNNRDNQRFQGSRPAQNQGSESSRLVDLMKQIRRDGPIKPKTDNADDQPFWRDGTQRQDNRGDNAGRGRASFLNRNKRQENASMPRPNRVNGGGGGGGNRQRYKKKADLEFLQGRLDRVESDTSPQSSRMPDENQVVTLPTAPVALSEASALLRIKMDDIKRKLRSISEPVPYDSESLMNVDTIELLALEFGIETERSTFKEAVESEDILISQRRVNDEAMALPPRPPVVCIMGHVDHGKTTLMDALRRRSMNQHGDGKPKKAKSKKKNQKGKGSAPASDDVAGTEAGGITQIISAFQVALEGQDMPVTFLDTPGHSAFRSMRQSGSHAADVIVLVVAADDGVSEQTVEILDFYKSIVKGSEGGISLVVALNKIDKPGIDVAEAQRRIENQLLEHGIIAEGMRSDDSEFGSPVQVIPTSGLTGQGLEDLMEGLLLQSEVMDLRADDKALAEGIIMDASIEKGLGVVATAIIRWGTMKSGDIVVSGDQIGRVKILKDVYNKQLKQGLPSQPVTIVGFKALPKAGDPITCVESEEKAEELVERRAALEKENLRCDAAPGDVEIHIPGMRSRDNARARRVLAKADIAESDGVVRIPVIVKADADGSLAAIRESLISLGQESKHDVIIDPVLEGIGNITVNDIQMAKESNAVIFSFCNKRVDQATLNLADSENVKIHSNAIIYSLLDEARNTLGSYLPPTPVEHVHGSAAVQAIFSIGTDDGVEKIAGLKVLDGHIYNDKTKLGSLELKCHYRVMRDGRQISPEGEAVRASSLRRYKELVDSVRLGEECGLGLSGFSDFEEGDTIECYSVEMKTISL
eukprot:scaffold473_cov132-Cylindrotheca_fusiformis.AAC.22